MMMNKRIAIHTLDARDHVMLEVMRDVLDHPDMLTYIQGELAQTDQILKSKGINYTELKTALVPNTQKREIVLVFDRNLIPPGWYGYSVHSKIIPLIPRDSNHSILAGDYIDNRGMQEVLHKMLLDNLRLASDRKLEYQHSSQYYFVYFNNVSNAIIAKFHTGLSDYEPYVGYIDLTFASPMKTYISSILINIGLKHRKFIIRGFEDGKEDINISGYPYEENGFVCKCTAETQFMLFLSYKIERPVYPGFETDTEFSLNAINPTFLPLSKLDIRVDIEKFKYLLTEKTGSLKRAGLIADTPENLKALIREKISSNYIYNLSYDKEHDTTKFDILLETPPVDNSSSENTPIRIMVALEYMPTDQTLRLITLY